MDLIEIWVNCPSAEVAERIAEALLQEHLVACANIYPPIRSAYHWHGRIEREEEVPLLLKSRAGLFGRLEELVRKLHPYETPSIVGLSVQAVNEDYRAWVIAETGG